MLFRSQLLLLSQPYKRSREKLLKKEKTTGRFLGKTKFCSEPRSLSKIRLIFYDGTMGREQISPPLRSFITHRTQNFLRFNVPHSLNRVQEGHSHWLTLCRSDPMKPSQGNQPAFGILPIKRITEKFSPYIEEL